MIERVPDPDNILVRGAQGARYVICGDQPATGPGS
jgi:hypothetical protein